MASLKYLMIIVLIVSCQLEKLTEEDKQLQKDAVENFKPLPDSIIDVKKNEKLISLGKKLYFEKKLSINNTISCSSCHNLDTFGVDNQATSPGHDGTRGGRNSPTSLNAALHIAQFWDGRAKDVEAQALGPILNPIEHGLPSEKAALKKLSDAGYISEFQTAFGKKNSFTYKNIGVAIGAFERTLLTPSRFDDYLKGDLRALNKMERKGLKKFMEVGCVSCHNGVGVGGGDYQMLGLAEKYPKNKDKGRFEITKNPDDKFVFKVPGLRNVIKTSPPFQLDGSCPSGMSCVRAGNLFWPL